MGAAVDYEEVTKDPGFVLNDHTNWGTVKSDYGKAIKEVVLNFSNLFNPEDNLLKDGKIPAVQVYRTFEGDLALGNYGYHISN